MNTNRLIRETNLLIIVSALLRFLFKSLYKNWLFELLVVERQHGTLQKLHLASLNVRIMAGQLAFYHICRYDWTKYSGNKNVRMMEKKRKPVVWYIFI